MLNWQGTLKIKAFDKDNNLIDETDLTNLITSAGKNLLAEALRESILDCEIKYVAIGSDNTTPNAADTTLGNETFRKAVTSQIAGGTGVTITNLYVAPEEAVGTIEEIGFFSGTFASATTDSGILFARVLYSRTKTAVESIQIERTDTIG
jgi:hypothetical protein